MKKVVIGGQIIITDQACEYLDTETKLCTVYLIRHYVTPHCLSIPEAIKTGILPADCAYVQGLTNYNPALEINDTEEGLHQ